jgi:hypothetical protein
MQSNEARLRVATAMLVAMYSRTQFDSTVPMRVQRRSLVEGAVDWADELIKEIQKDTRGEDETTRLEA